MVDRVDIDLQREEVASLPVRTRSGADSCRRRRATTVWTAVRLRPRQRRPSQVQENLGWDAAPAPLDEDREHVPGSLTGQWSPASWGLDLDRAEDSNPHAVHGTTRRGPTATGLSARTVARTWRCPNRGCAVGLRGPAPRGMDRDRARESPRVCPTDPGHAVDLTISSSAVSGSADRSR